MTKTVTMSITIQVGNVKNKKIKVSVSNSRDNCNSKCKLIKVRRWKTIVLPGGIGIGGFKQNPTPPYVWLSASFALLERSLMSISL